MCVCVCVHHSRVRKVLKGPLVEMVSRGLWVFLVQPDPRDPLERTGTRSVWLTFCLSFTFILSGLFPL